MRILKTASGKRQIKISKKEWESMGKKAGWMEDNNHLLREEIDAERMRDAQEIAQEQENALNEDSNVSLEEFPFSFEHIFGLLKSQALKRSDHLDHLDYLEGYKDSHIKEVKKIKANEGEMQYHFGIDNGDDYFYEIKIPLFHTEVGRKSEIETVVTFGMTQDGTTIREFAG
jgi:hypothetical protein